MSLNWDSVYAVALELRSAHPNIEMQDLTLRQIYDWTIALPDFRDDPSLCNDEILASIFQEWYEVRIND